VATGSLLEIAVSQMTLVRLIDELGRLVAIAEPSSVSGLLHPAVVLR
jgi:hypothetical protein